MSLGRGENSIPQTENLFLGVNELTFLTPLSRRRLLKAGALTLSTGLAGCATRDTGDDDAATTVTPAPIPTDEPTETQPTTPQTTTQTQTPEPVWLHMSATPRSDSRILESLFWRVGAFDSRTQALVTEVLESETFEVTATERSSLGRVTFVETDETYYRIDREELGDPKPLEYEISFTAVTTCPDTPDVEREHARSEAIPFSSLSTIDQSVTSEFDSIFDEVRCGSMIFWYEFDSHQAVRDSVYTQSGSFHVEYKDEVWRVSSKVARYATKYPHYRYSVTKKSSSRSEFSLPEEFVSHIDTDSLLKEEQVHLATLLEDGHLKIQDTNEATLITRHLLNRLTEAGQRGPGKHFYFEVNGEYYALDYWFTQEP